MGIAVDWGAVPEKHVAICRGKGLAGPAGRLGAINEAGEIAGAGGGLGTNQHSEEEDREPVL